jgi:hypothetical protein
MGRYREPPAHMVTSLAAAQNRISKMERIPRATNTAIDSGGLTVNGGLLQVSGLLPTGKLGSPVFLAQGGQGASSNSVKMYRNNGADSSAASLPAFEYDDIPISGATQTPSIMMRDRYGGRIVADSTYGRGLSEPKYHVHFYDPSDVKTTTSGAFVTVMLGFWAVYHPHLQVTVIVNTPAATTVELLLQEVGGQIHSDVTTVASTNQFYGLVADRSLLNSGGNTNGESAWMQIQWRLASGTSAASFTFIEALACNLAV